MSAMAWVKLHTEILGDPKLMRAARKGAKRLELLPWLIAFAAEAGDGGRLTVNGEPAEPQDIAEKIPGIRANSVEQCIESCRDLNILVLDSDDSLRFSAWKKRAGKPSDLAENVATRVKRFREKQAQAVDAEGDRPTTPPPDVTRVKRAETPMKRVSRAFRNAIEVEGEEEEERRGRLRAEKVESRELSAPAPDPAPPAAAPALTADALPPGARAFATHFYPRGTATKERRLDVAQQLVDTLNGGARYKRGILVRAGSLERLDAKCREVLAEGMKDPDKAIRVLLDKLGDVSDLGPNGEGPGEQLREELHAQEREDAADRAVVDRELDRWSGEHPEERERLHTAVLRDFKVTHEEDIAALQRVMFDARLRHELVRAMRPEQDPMRPAATPEPHAQEAHADTS